MKLMQAQAMSKICLVLLCLATGPLWAGTEGTSSTFYGQAAGASGSGSNGSNTFIGYGAGASNTSGDNNTFLGYGAGYYNATSVGNTFLGYHAGLFNTTGDSNTFLGFQAGSSNTTGYDNLFLGWSAGYSNTTGQNNVLLGFEAGYSNTVGQGNVFLGYKAGFYETGSNKLYIDNCLSGGCAPPLIYGEFDNHLLKMNGVVNVRSNGVAKSQMHFSQNDTDTGGFLTSVLDNNFFVSSGARYDGTAGGWIQRSPDTNAVIAGSGGAGYRVFTHTGSTVGATFTPTVRLHIDYSGQFGINTAPVAGHEIHTSSGAYLAAGTWTDASSRDYKERIAPLSGDAAAQTLAALNPVTFVYKSDAAQGHVGFIAEDVPDLVATRDRKGLSPMDIVAVLTKVVQEKSRMLDDKSKTIDDLAATVSRLQVELDELKGRIPTTHQ